jgi:hypothetical protein
LLCLFGYLARKGIQPFSNENVKYEEIAKKPNWKNLPSEFHYLIDAAEAFAAQSTEADAIDFLENVHPKDSEALARVAETVRLNGHAKKINEWFKKFPLHMHPEASLVFSLLMLMDHAGLKFE